LPWREDWACHYSLVRHRSGTTELNPIARETHASQQSAQIARRNPNSAEVQPLTLQSPVMQTGPGYTTPLKSDAGRTIPPAASATPITGPKKYLDARAEEYSKTETDWGNSVQASAEAQQRMAAILGAKQYQTGAYANDLSNIRASLKAVGVNLPDSVAGDQAQAQIILKNNFGAAIQTMKSTGLSRWTQAELFSTHHRRHYGKENSRLLCWKAPSRTMNPTLRKSVVDEALAEDPEAAAAEYLAEFRSDVVAFVPREVAEDAVVAGRREVAPGSMAGLVNLVVHFDASGGGGADSFALAIAGRDLASGRAVLLCLREVNPPFSPEGICAEYATVARSYGLLEGQSDKFAGSWPKEQFDKHGISLYPSKTSSEIFVDFLPLLMSGKVELLDNPTLVNQIAGLERRTGRGRDHIAASGSGDDDVALAAAGALVRAAKAEAEIPWVEPFVCDETTHPTPDRWSARYWGEGAPVSRSYEVDTVTGTAAWTRQRLAERGQE